MAAAAVAYSKHRTSDSIAFEGDSVGSAAFVRHSSSLRDAYDSRHVLFAVAGVVAVAAAAVGLGAAIDSVAAAPSDHRLFPRSAIPSPGLH